MKRDMELIRKIMLAAESGEGGWCGDTSKIEGYTDHQIGYHRYLICASGLAKGDDTSCTEDTGPNWIIEYLTPTGHDFIESIRSDTVWNKTKDRIASTVGTASLEVFKQLAVKIGKEMLGI